MTITLHDDLYLVETIELSTKTEGGIHLAPEAVKSFEKAVGRVINVGPGLRNPQEPAAERLSMKAKVGDIVFFQRAMPLPIQQGGSEMRLVSDRDIVLTLEGVDAKSIRAGVDGGIVLPSPELSLAAANGKLAIS